MLIRLTRWEFNALHRSWCWRSRGRSWRRPRVLSKRRKNASVIAGRLPVLVSELVGEISEDVRAARFHSLHMLPHRMDFRA